mgnify:CR=1 FL=1
MRNTPSDVAASMPAKTDTPITFWPLEPEPDASISGTTLTAGQYWLGIQHINSSSSFNSGIRMSFYGSAHTLTGLAPMGSFSSAYSTGTNVAGGLGGNLYLGLGSYSVAGLTSLPSTISLSQVTQAGMNFLPYLRFSTRVT